MTSLSKTNDTPVKDDKGGLSDLILFVGDENVKIQYIGTALKEAKTNKKGETTISFWTKAVTTNEIMRPTDESNVGIVMWIPKGKIDAFLKS